MERIRQNYLEWGRIELIKGRVPDILPSIDVRSIAFLHLDMNCAYPEAAALRHFWPYISTGGIALFDDYAYFGCDAQARAISDVASAMGAEILVFPTGQGMIVK